MRANSDEGIGLGLGYSKTESYRFPMLVYYNSFLYSVNKVKVAEWLSGFFFILCTGAIIQNIVAIA